MNLMIFYKENNALNDRHIFLNQETFANAVKLKNETDIKGPTKYVDLQFENELLENQKVDKVVK